MTSAPVPSGPVGRLERDFLGEQPIPAGAYWGIGTARASKNFPVSGTPISTHRDLVAALGAVKQAAARANRETSAPRDPGVVHAVHDGLDVGAAGTERVSAPTDSGSVRCHHPRHPSKGVQKLVTRRGGLAVPRWPIRILSHQGPAAPRERSSGSGRGRFTPYQGRMTASTGSCAHHPQACA